MKKLCNSEAELKKKALPIKKGVEEAQAYLQFNSQQFSQTELQNNQKFWNFYDSLSWLCKCYS